MKVLVTGATGFLGEWLVQKLIEGGHDVRAFARASSRTETVERLGATVVRGGFSDPASLDRAMDGMRAVIHAAGGGIARSTAEIYRKNAGSTRALIRAAQRADCQRFVLVSSLAARDAISHYGQSKRNAELAALGAHGSTMHGDLHVVVLRPPALYGPGEHRMVPLFKAARRGFVPMVHPQGTLSLLHGEDCASALVAALHTPESGVFFVAERRIYQRREMAELIGRAVERDVTVVSVPPPLLTALAAASDLYGRVRDRPTMFGLDKSRDVLRPHQAADPSRAYEALDWSPEHSFEAGAREALSDYITRGWLRA